MNTQQKIINPISGRPIKIGGSTHLNLVIRGILPINTLSVSQQIRMPRKQYKFFSKLSYRIVELPTDIVIMTLNYLEYPYIDTLCAVNHKIRSILYDDNHPIWKMLVKRDLTDNFEAFKINAQSEYSNQGFVPSVAHYQHYCLYINIKDQNEILRLMSWRGYEKGVDNLLRQPGVNVDHDTGYPMRAASQFGHSNIVDMLLKAGSTYAQDAFSISLTSNHPETTRVLLEYAKLKPLQLLFTINTIQQIMKDGNLEMLKVIQKYCPTLHSHYDDSIRAHLLLTQREDVVSFMESLFTH